MLRAAVVPFLLLAPAFAGDGGSPPDDVPVRWDYPCSFTQGEGLWSDKLTPKGLQCDYLRAQLEKPREQLNGLPTLEAQKKFLSDILPGADQALKAYGAKRTEVLDTT